MRACSLCVKLSHQSSRSSGGFSGGSHLSASFMLYCTQGKHTESGWKIEIRPPPLHLDTTIFSVFPSNCFYFTNFSNFYSHVLHNLQSTLLFRNLQHICESLHISYKAMLIRLGCLFECGSLEKTRRR